MFGSASFLAHLSIVKNNKKYAFLAILIPTLVGGFRYMVGIDYLSYVKKLQFLAEKDFFTYVTSSLINIFEPTFYFMSHLTLATSDQAIIFFSITSALIALFYYLAARRYSLRHVGLMFFMMLTTVFPRDLNGVRQGIAVAISFYAISFISEGRKWKFIVLVLMASLFHYSAIIILIAYPLYWIFYEKWPFIKDNNYLAKIVGLSGFGYFFVMLLIKNLARIPFLGRYAYLISPKMLAATGSPNIIAKIVPILLVLPVYPKLVQQDKNNAYYMLLSVFAALLTSLGTLIGFIYRIANYFAPFYAILFINTIDVFDDKRKAKLMKLFIVVYAVTFFVGSNLVRNSNGIFPYRFIFMGLL